MADNQTAETGAELIAAERQRQIEAEGYTASWDAAYESDCLSRAAAMYALPARLRKPREDSVVTGIAPEHWPWGARFWKPTPDDRVRELVKAGALIAAEIDRLQRRAASDV